MKKISSNKIFDVMAWGIIICLMFIFAGGFVDLPENNDQAAIHYVNFSMSKPMIYRVFVPIIARLLTLLGMPAGLALASIIFVSGIAAYWQMKRLFGEHWIYAPLCFISLYTLLINYAKPIDFMTVFFFLLSYNLFKAGGIRDLTLYLLLFPVMVLHRETTILLVFLYGIYFINRLSPRSYLISSAYQLLAYGFIKIILMEIFKNAPGSTLYIFYYDVMGVYLRSPAMIAALFILIGIFAVAYSRWSLYDPFIKAAFALVPIQILLHIILGNPFEFRVLAESFPIAYLIMMQGITMDSPLLHHDNPGTPNTLNQIRS